MKNAQAPAAGADRTEENGGIDLERARELARRREEIAGEIGKVIVGQEKVIDLLLIALFSRGHGLFVGVPGLAKTLLIQTLASVLNLTFGRIQFTPDLMPADITGTDILEEDRSTGKRIFRFVRGPLFANILLADEINRTSPKTQAALLQAMQEYRVTAGGNTYPLDLPFLVFATQNPIEQEGTYPLPEAQLDRFMFSVAVDYPSAAEEEAIVRSTTGTYRADLTKTLDAQKIIELQETVLRAPAPESVVRYAVSLARASRPREEGAAIEEVKRYVAWGAGPRASQYLILGAKARAVLAGRYAADVEDVRSLAHPILRHRIITNFRAEAEGIDSDAVVERLLEAVKP